MQDFEFNNNLLPAPPALPAGPGLLVCCVLGGRGRGSWALWVGELILWVVHMLSMADTAILWVESLLCEGGPKADWKNGCLVLAACLVNL